MTVSCPNMMFSKEEKSCHEFVIVAQKRRTRLCTPSIALGTAAPDYRYSNRDDGRASAFQRAYSYSIWHTCAGHPQDDPVHTGS
jgi:hypothetical protein